MNINLIINQITLEKRASELGEISDLEQALSDAYKRHGRKAAIGAAVAMAAMPLVHIHANRVGIRESESGSTPHIMKEHPYLSSLGTSLLSGAAKIPASMIPIAGPLAVGGLSEGIKANIANHLSKEIDKGNTDGVLGRFSKNHPYIGPAISALIPGAGGINAHLAGESLASDAIKNKSFMSRHPYMSAYMSELVPIPGFYRSHAHAAAKILNEQEG